MQSRVVFVVWMAICALAIQPALGQPVDALKKAQSAFDQAQLDYLQGKYDEAAQGFQDAYAARQFPQFLYNVGASFHMKGKKASDPEAYQKAVDAYRHYLTEDPKAADKAKVEKAIGVLEAEIKRIKEQPGTGVGTGSAAGQRGRRDPGRPVAGGRAARRRQGARPGRDRERAVQRDDLRRRQAQGLVRDHAVVRHARGRSQDHHREARLHRGREDDLGRSDQAVRAVRRDVAAELPGLDRDQLERPGRRHLPRRQVGRRGRPDPAVAEHQARQAHVLDHRRRLRRVQAGDRRDRQRGHADQGARSRARRSASSTSPAWGSRTRRSSSTARCCASAARASRACSRATTP